MVGRFVLEPFGNVGKRLMFELDGTKKIPLSYSVFPEKDGTYRIVSIVGGKKVTTIPLSIFRLMPIDYDTKETIEEKLSALPKEEREKVKYAAIVEGEGVFFTDGELHVELPEIKADEMTEKEKKKKLKVYETPDETKKALLYAAGSIYVKEYAKRFIGKVLGEMLNSSNPETLLRAVERNFDGVPVNPSPDEVKEILRSTVSRYSRGGLSEKDLERLLKFRRIEPDDFYRIVGLAFNGTKVIELASLLSKYKATPEMAVVDWQAGVGDHAQILDEFGIKSEVFGLEIRQAPEPLPKGNRVLYGKNFREYVPAIKRFRNSENARVPVYFLNPPYTADRQIELETLDCVPRYSLAVGVFPEKLLGVVKKNFQGVAVIVPKEEVGYTEEEAPQNFVLFVGRKFPEKAHVRVIDGDEFKNPKKFAAFINALTTVAGGNGDVPELSVEKLEANFFRQNLAKGVTGAMKVVEKGDSPLKRTEDFINAVEKNREVTLSEIEEFKRLKVNLGDDLSLIQKALDGAPVFPDVRFFGEKPLKNFYQVARDLTLLSIYKNDYPELYGFLKKVAEKKNYPLPAIPDGDRTEYVTTENLGIMKLRYVPRTIQLTPEVKEILLSFIENVEEREKTEQLIEELEKQGIPLKLTVKSTIGEFETAGELEFGITPILVLTDDTSREYAGLKIPLANFYEELERAGIIDVSRRVQIVEPDEKLKAKVLSSFVADLDALAKRYGVKITKKDLMTFRDFLVKKKIGKLTLMDWAADRVKESGLLERFKEDVIEPESAEDLIKESLRELSKATGEEIPYRQIARKVAEVYEKAPYKFFEERDKADRFIERVLLESGVSPEKAGEVKTTVWDSLGKHFANYLKLVSAVGKLYLGMLTAQMIKVVPEPKKWQFLEFYLMNISGVKPHQYKESIRAVAKVLKTGEAGHLLGWEMRSGKTLTMFLTGYFYKAVTGKPVYFFPRPANVNDAISQMVEFLPFLAPRTVAYRSGDNEPAMQSHRVRTVLGDREYLFPNLYAVISRSRTKGIERVIATGGEGIKELSKTYAKEMEKLISIAREKGADFSEIKGEFSFLKDLKGYEPPVVVALYWYLERLKDRGVLNLDYLPLLRDALLKHGENLELQLESDPEKNEQDFFYLVPKSKLKNLNYEVEIDRAVATFDNLTVHVANDVSFENVPFSGKAEAIEELIVEPEGDLVLVGSSAEAVKRIFELVLDRPITDDEVEQYFDVSEKTVMKRLNSKGEVDYELKAVVVNYKESFPEELKERFELELYDRGFEPYREKLAREIAFSITTGSRVELNVELKGIPYFDGRNYYVAYPEVREIDSQNPIKDRRTPVTLKGTLSVRKRGKDKVVVSFEAERDPKLPVIMENSSSNAMTTLVSKEQFRNFGGGVIVDEVDESTGLEGVEYRAIFYLSRQAGLRVGGTGTPTSGYPETTMALLGLISDYPLSTIRDSMNEIKQNYSVYALSDTKKVPYLITALYLKIPDELKIQFFKELDFVNNAEDEIVASEFKDFVSRYLKVVKEPSLEALFESIDKFYPSQKIAKEVSDFYLTFAKAVKSKGYDVEGDRIPENVFKSALLDTKFIRRAAGTFDPIGFVSALSGASFSLNTRENLKSEARGYPVKEVKNFDYENLNDVYSEMKERGYVAVGSLPALLDFVSADGTQELRLTSDVKGSEMLSEYSLPDVYSFVINNAELLYRHYLKNPETLAKMTGLSPSEVKTLLAPRKKQTGDGVLDYLKEYLYSNYVLPDGIPEEKKKVFNAFLTKLGEFIDLLQKEAQRIKFQLKAGQEATVVWEGEKLTPTVWESKDKDGEGIAVSFKNGALVVKGREVRFSDEVEVFKPDWEKIKGALPIRFRFEYLNPSSYELADVLSNKGHEDKIKELSKEGYSFLITSPRTLGVLAGIYDALASLLDRENKDREVHVLVNALDKTVYNALSKLDRNYLEKNGIKLKLFRNSTSLDVESQKLKRINAEREKKGDEPYQIIVASVDTAISRGVDLSHLDEMVVMGANTSGKTASQLFARLFSVNRDEADVYICGKPLMVRNAGQEYRVYPNGQFYRTKALLDKVNFIDQVVGGKLVNVLNFAKGKTLELTSSAEKVLGLDGSPDVGY